VLITLEGQLAAGGDLAGVASVGDVTWHAPQSMTGAFSAAQAAIDARDPGALQAVLDRAPGVVNEPGGENRNTLVAMAAGTCDERTVTLLLQAGADPDRPNVHGWTALHQAAYMNAVHLVDMLIGAGARMDASARGDGGTPLVVALFWGNAEVARRLVAAGGVLPRNLRAAAGVGDLGLVAEVLGTPEASRHRAFYRPHSGFPEWAPSHDPDEILAEALSYAARNGHVPVVDLLVRARAEIDADVYRGTALIWAASRGHGAVVACLLESGADPNTRATFGGPLHGEGVTALHIAAEAGHTAIAEQLLAAGADPSIVDGNGYGTPAGWAAHNGHEFLAALITDYAA